MTEQQLGSKAHSGYSGLNIASAIKAERNMKSADLNYDPPGVQVKIRRRNKNKPDECTDLISKTPQDQSEIDSAKETLPIKKGKASVSVGISTKEERNMPTLQSQYPKYPKKGNPVQAPVAIYRPRWTTSGFYNQQAKS